MWSAVAMLPPWPWRESLSSWPFGDGLQDCTCAVPDSTTALCQSDHQTCERQADHARRSRPQRFPKPSGSCCIGRKGARLCSCLMINACAVCAALAASRKPVLARSACQRRSLLISNLYSPASLGGANFSFPLGRAQVSDFLSFCGCVHVLCLGNPAQTITGCLG
jgi:hypothetical protein